MLDKSTDSTTITFDHYKVSDYFKSSVSNCFISGYLNMDEDHVNAKGTIKMSHRNIELKNGNEPLNSQLLVNRENS